MPIGSSSPVLQEHIFDLLWSLWSEAGVSGWTRRHSDCALDPEPLILFTARLGDADPRLRDESMDWCIRYGRFISASRLRNLLRSAAPEENAAFGEYAATVSLYGHLSWPGATEPRRLQPSGKSLVVDFQRPALTALRLRALFGVGARAEIIRGFVAQSDSLLSATDLAQEASYTRRNVEKELDSLRMAGLLDVSRLRGQLHYRVARPGELLAFVGKLPTTFPRWDALFRILNTVVCVARQADSLDPAVAAVEARRAIRAVEADFDRAGVPEPPLEVTGAAFWPAFQEWALRLTKQLAAGQLLAPKIPRHGRGGWRASDDFSA